MRGHWGQLQVSKVLSLSRPVLLSDPFSDSSSSACSQGMKSGAACVAASASVGSAVAERVYHQGAGTVQGLSNLFYKPKKNDDEEQGGEDNAEATTA